MNKDLTTHFVGRLRAQDPEAWFELWETFGPVLRAQLSRWGRGYIGWETVQDLSQETMAALAGAVHRHDPSKGARFSTWLLAIARHTLGDEVDRRMALKRGSGVRPSSLDAAAGSADGGLGPDAAYEEVVFEAKVSASLRATERECDFLDFSVFRMRVLETQSGKDVARALGTSEPTISRRLARARSVMRRHLGEVFSKYSFTDEEWAELERKGLDPNPKKGEDAAFDDAVAEIYHRISERQRAEAGGSTT